MRVAQVLPYSSHVEANMCMTFERVGIDTWIVTSDKLHFRYRGTGIKFEEYPKTIKLPCLEDPIFLKGYAPSPIIPSLLRTVENLNVDVVVVHEHISMATWFLTLFQKGWKTVLTEHGNEASWSKKRDKIFTYLAKKILVPRIDGFVAIALRTKRFLESMGAKNVSIIPNPVDCSLFKPCVPYEDRENIVLYVGKIDTSRGLHTLLKAMRKVKGAQLWVIGGKGNLSHLIERKKDRVKNLGTIPHSEMPKYYNFAKVFVNPYPSKTGAGCGCALSEALACGTPIVGTKQLDFPFIWRDGEIGYLARAKDSTSLAEAIVKTLNHGNELHRSCRRIALREFSHESIGKRYLKVFKQILGSE